MATILEFRQPDSGSEGAAAVKAPVKYPKGRSAEIIIFPGVRIERHEDPGKPAVATKAKKRTKRAVRRKS